MKHLLCTVVVGCLSGVAFGQKEADQKIEPGPKVPGGKVLEWTSPQGQPYWYRVPKKVSKRKPPNLLLMLHGTGMRWGWAFWNYPIAAGKWRPDDIVVAPEGLTPGNGAFNFIQGKKDGDQIAGLIKLFKKRFPIRKVYVYGHSQGAFFAYWIAGQYPQLVDGIVAHAGNVLGNVKHPALAKKKLGVGILHGKADAVVTVECAYRTEKVYKKLGYKNVKLYVVEGLTKRSGHWPLPKQVGEMLEWLDQITADTPDQAISVVLDELGQKEPDVRVVADAGRKLRSLAKKARGADKETAKTRLEQIDALLGEARSAHQTAILAYAETADRKKPFGEWVEHLRVVDAAFADSPDWKRDLKPLRSLAARHHKQVAKALKGLGKPSARSFNAGLKALRTAFLADRYEDLQTTLIRLAENPPRGIREKALSELADLSKSRAAAIEKGRAAAAKVTTELMTRLRNEGNPLLSAKPEGQRP